MKSPRGWLPLALLVAGGGVALTLAPPKLPQAVAQSPTPAAADGWNIAVVDYSSLLKNHPEFENLKQLDEQLASLKEDKDLAPYLAQKNARGEMIEKMEKAVEKAKAEMEAEKSRLEGELAGLSASLQGAMEAELNRVKGGYDREIEELVEKYKKQHAPTAPAPGPASRPDAPTDSAPASVNEYREGLLLVRQRNLTARKLELEKSIRGEIEAERARFDQQMAATEDQIAGQYQEEKLNLQLKLQVTQDEAEQQKLQDRLSVISEEISSKKSAKRAELEAGFSEFRAKKNAEFESLMSSYQSKLDAEVAQKVGGWRAPEQPRRQPEAPRPNQAPPPVPKEIEAKVAEARAGINSRMAAKKAELEGAMQAKAAQARAQIMAKQEEIQKRLKETEEELKGLFEEKKKNLDSKTQQKIAALEKQIEKVQKERDVLYDRMIADINGVVGEVAKKKDIPMVLGQVVFNRTCQDLTDFSMVGVKQLGSR